MGVGHYLAVATPELIGVLAWWAVVLVAPVLFIRRWRRRRLIGGTRGAPDTADGGRHRISPDRDDGWLSSETLAPLCRYVDFRRRLELAVAELERRLALLPAERWRIEPYPLTGERRNTLLILGETGVFVISATYAPGHWDDVITVNRLAGKIQSLLPGYPAKVHPAICHPFSSLPPRLWYRKGGESEWIAAWLIGGASVLAWLEHFGRDHGLGPADLEQFGELSKPNWLRPAIPTSATWPPLPDWSRSPVKE